MDDEPGKAFADFAGDGNRSLPRAATVRRVSPDDRRDALALLLTGQSRGDLAAVDAFLQFAKTHQYATDLLWRAHTDDGAEAALLLMPSPGRTALLFVSPVRRETQRTALAAAVRRACDEVDRSRVRMVQGLLEPSQVLERKALVDAGFMPLATLQYLEASVLPQHASPLEPPEGTTLLNWSHRTRDRFAAATLGSYEATLDCPGLVGLREIDDILDGHMATGQFDADLWFTLVRGDEPVGVMMLNGVPEQPAVELVYLGLCPAWRGRGLGRRLLEHAMWTAVRRDVSKMLLAVDQDNTPACRLYRAMGFRPTSRKYAMLFALS